jgi:hypothetical protein
MAKRKIEVFTAGCYVCDGVVKKIKELTCPNCEVIVYDLNKKCETNECEDKAKQYGIKSVPAVAISGKLIDCCTNKGVDFETLKRADLGQ